MKGQLDQALQLQGCSFPEVLYTLVQFGAGNIGRSFIAPTFTQAGWRVVFIGLSDDMLAALQNRGNYCMTVDNNTERQSWLPILRRLMAETLLPLVLQWPRPTTNPAVGLGALRFIALERAGLQQRQHLRYSCL